MTTQGQVDHNGEYPIPTKNSLPFDITAGPDGALWFVEFGRSQIGRISAQLDRHVGTHEGHFGMIAAEDDPAVFDALLRTVERWHRARGVSRVVGPSPCPGWFVDTELAVVFPALKFRLTNDQALPVAGLQLGVPKTTAALVSPNLQVPATDLSMTVMPTFEVVPPTSRVTTCDIW